MIMLAPKGGGPCTLKIAVENLIQSLLEKIVTFLNLLSSVSQEFISSCSPCSKRVELSLLNMILCFFLTTGSNSYSQCSTLNQRFSPDASDAYPPLLKRMLLHLAELVASFQNLPHCKEWCCQTDWSFSNSFCSTFVIKMLKITRKRKGTDLESEDNKIQGMTKNRNTDTCDWKSHWVSLFWVLGKNKGNE